MRTFALVFLLSSMILTACSGSDPCLTTNVVCLERESPDNLVMKGVWTGTYHVGRHFIGDNDLRLTWNNDTYSLRVEREGVERELFYKTKSFYGYGTLQPGQAHFRARYATDEIWHFYGRYYNDDAQLVFKGWIETNGKTIGDFRLARNKQCASILRRRENVCVEDASPSGIRPVIGDVLIAPNPVSAGAQVTLEAAAAPVAEWRWEVSIVPVTDPTRVFATYEQQAETFHLETTAPTTPGGYAVRFRATGNDYTDEKEDSLEVR
jgi:hypothetical protein